MLIHGHETIRSGMAALVGPPNVGKSTLLNRLLGQKISIVSPKPQTTRNRIAGILNGTDYQIVILDTPGIHQARSDLNREMVKTALATLKEVDVILFMIDAASPPPKENQPAPEFLAQGDTPAILLINKVDLIDKPRLLPVIKRYEELYPFSSMIPISASHGDGMDLVLQAILPHLPLGPRLYPEDIPTDATERFIASEIIREKIFLLTGEEIPYATAVLVDSFKEDEEKGRITIHATIFVEKKSQKGIIIGQNGKKIKEIGSRARQDIGQLLGRKTTLNLWVKVRQNWTKDAKFLRELGL